MQIRFVRQWRGARPGDLRDVPDGAARVLLKRGFAVATALKDPPPCVRTRPRSSKR
ncbi:MAG: hypothetical protein ACOY3P_03555 [Planctomycetota bacterium]